MVIYTGDAHAYEVESTLPSKNMPQATKVRPEPTTPVRFFWEQRMRRARDVANNVLLNFG